VRFQGSSFLLAPASAIIHLFPDPFASPQISPQALSPLDMNNRQDIDKLQDVSFSLAPFRQPIIFLLRPLASPPSP